jgi:hypothetical protein
MTPALPEPCRWVSTVDEAVNAVTDDQIPLIHPQDRNRAQRWASVMDWYEPLSSARSSGPDNGSAVVVSSGSAENLGRLAGTALGRPHHHVDTLTNTNLLPTAASVLVVTPAADATLNALTPALNLWGETATRVGFLTGRDPAGIVFSLAKILAADSTGQTRELEPELLTANGLPPDIDQHETGRTVVFDGRSGRARWLGESGHPIHQRSALEGNWYAMVISARGDAGHAWLDKNVLCGLSRPEEYDLVGRELVAGCLDDTCKLSPHAFQRPLHPHRLSTFVLVLLVPNAVAVGRGERYPSEISLALDALEGYPAAVLGLTRGDVSTSDLEAGVAGQMLHAGTPLGWVSRDLNLGIARRGLPHAVVLLGDPEYAPPAAVGAAVPAVDVADNTELPVIISGQCTVPALVVGHRALLADPETDARADDALADVADLFGQLRGWAARLAEAELIEVILTEARSSMSTADAECGLGAMRSARMAALREVAGTIRHLERFRELREPGMPVNPEPKLDELAGEWATELAGIVFANADAVIESLIAGLTAHHHIARRGSASPCDACGAPCQRQHYASALPIGNRTEHRCPRCGITASHPDGGSAVMLNAPREANPGESATAQAIVDRPWGSTGLLFVQLRPTSTDFRETALCYSTAEVGTTSFTLDVPEDATLDLHRICAFYACRFQIAVAQARVPVVPAYDPVPDTAPKTGPTP